MPATTRHPSPIGAFDSGLGGLSVLRDVRALLPQEDLVYIADSAWCPYGAKEPAVIAARAAYLTERLLGFGAKIVLVACNTATIAAVESLRATYPVAFVGMEPAIKPAVAATRRGVVGVLATGAALAGERFHRLVEHYAGEVRVITQPCPGLVERVEAGDLDGPETRALVRRYVRPLVEAGADVLVLGCTHYPFLRDLIQATAGNAVRLVDSGTAVARQVRHVLEQDGLLESAGREGSITFHTSGSLEPLGTVLPRLWPGWATPPQALGD